MVWWWMDTGVISTNHSLSSFRQEMGSKWHFYQPLSHSPPWHIPLCAHSSCRREERREPEALQGKGAHRGSRQQGNGEAYARIDVPAVQPERRRGGEAHSAAGGGTRGSVFTIRQYSQSSCCWTDGDRYRRAGCNALSVALVHWMIRVC